MGLGHQPRTITTTAPSRDSAAGIRAVKISLVVLGITAAAQVAVVVVSGSVALFADTVHNFSDALTAVPLWIAFAMSRRSATRRYTYGFGRVEDLAGLFVLAVIAISAAVAAIEAVQRLVHPVPLSHLGWVAGAGVIGFVGNEIVAVYRITGRQADRLGGIEGRRNARPHRRFDVSRRGRRAPSASRSDSRSPTRSWGWSSRARSARCWWSPPATCSGGYSTASTRSWWRPRTGRWPNGRTCARCGR